MNTASPTVLVGVLGLHDEVRAYQIVARRDVRPFASMEGLYAFFSEEEQRQIRQYLDVKSDYFRITARAYRDRRAVEVHALARRDLDGETEVVQWLF